jgi:hypothetical protein
MPRPMRWTQQPSRSASAAGDSPDRSIAVCAATPGRLRRADRSANGTSRLPLSGAMRASPAGPGRLSRRTTCERFRGLAADDRNRAGSERGLSGGPDDCVSSLASVSALTTDTLACTRASRSPQCSAGGYAVRRYVDQVDDLLGTLRAHRDGTPGVRLCGRGRRRAASSMSARRPVSEFAPREEVRRRHPAVGRRQARRQDVGERMAGLDDAHERLEVVDSQ